MISIKAFIDRLQDASRKYQSSFDTGDALAGKINQAQGELTSYLYSIYEVNQHALDLLSPMIKTVPVISTDAGVIRRPNDFRHHLDLLYLKGNKEYQTHYIATNQVGIIERIPQRRGDESKNRINYTFRNRDIQLFPKKKLKMLHSYVKAPADVKIVYDIQEVRGEDVRVLNEDKSTVLEWDMTCFNLLHYMTLDLLGISSRDQVLIELSHLGIEREAVDLSN